MMQFKTPATNGRHWDVSDGDIQVGLDEAKDEAEVEVEDYDEIEYMPPKMPGMSRSCIVCDQTFLDLPFESLMSRDTI